MISFQESINPLRWQLLALCGPFPGSKILFPQAIKSQKQNRQRSDTTPTHARHLIFHRKAQVMKLMFVLIIGFLTMLKTQRRAFMQDRTQNHSTIHYFQSQMTKSTIEIKNSMNLSPSVSQPKKENRDRSNLDAGQFKEGKKSQEGMSLREKINIKLQKQCKSRRTASTISEVSAVPKKIIQNQRQQKECLSSIRKMLTEQSPPRASQETIRNIQTKRANKKNRQIQRQQFQQRQLQMILQRKEKQQAAKAQRLQNQTRQCTFKPRLTVYKRR